MQKSEWKATDSRWWPLPAIGAALGAAVVLLVPVLITDASPHLIVLSAAVGALQLLGTSRARLRLTADGVEVRRIRTRTYRWADIESAQVAPPWDTSSAIWLRLRGSVPQSAPEVLVPPGGMKRRERKQQLEDLASRITRAAEQAAPPATRAARTPD